MIEKLGRYGLFDELARGGMAAIHLARVIDPGASDHGKVVAIKRLHRHLAKDDEFVTMLLDEALLVRRIQHPNVVGLIDVLANDGEVLMVMDYVPGETLLKLIGKTKRQGGLVRPGIVSAVLIDGLRGLHAAHTATNDRGAPLGMIHRDFTPHNLMVREDGRAVVVDFGVAKASGRNHTTEEGKIKGKLPYMAPEQVRGHKLTCKVDVYAAGAVLWELLVGERLIPGNSEAEVLERLLYGQVRKPSTLVSGISSKLEAVVLRALSREPAGRYDSALEMASALEDAASPASPSEVAAWMFDLAKVELDERRELFEYVLHFETDQARPRPKKHVEEARAANQAPSSPPPKQVEAEKLSDGSPRPLKPDDTSQTTDSSIRLPLVDRRGLIAGLVGLVTLSLVLAVVAWPSPEPTKPTGAPSAKTEGPTKPPSVPALEGSPNMASTVIAASATLPEATPSSTTATALGQTQSEPRDRPRVEATPKFTATATARPSAPKKCLPVTRDASGKKIYHPECMDE